MSGREITVGGQTYAVRTDAGGLSNRGRVIAWLIAMMLVLTAGFAVVSASGDTLTGRAPSLAQEAASAEVAESGSGDDAAVDAASGSGASADGTATGTVLDDAIVAEWDGATTHLDWRGDGYETAEASFIGSRIASPGDQVQRTLSVGNAGPSDAVLTISLVLAQQVPELAQNPDFADHIQVFWDVAGVQGSELFSTLQERDGAQPVVARVKVAQDADVAVTVGFRMDVDDEGARALGEESARLSFSVLARMAGDVTVAPQPAPEVPPILALTGLQLAALIMAAALALGLILAGILLVTRRRRRCDVCDRRLERDDPWIMVHDDDGRRRVCLDCAPQALGGAGIGIPIPAPGPTRWTGRVSR